ncbi:hypothetical protein EDEG_01484 [Edhazardia aedis USNM 41457]|uniref:Uncharacterized protein n=1 Tax=Edhazardia aedis (strain USNM 41457) TaxID=1003232 RepID=J9DSD7_EDHAE|nr:hypothetical protein EDEG_01484 [Edhazardia aedis USNM 41457]|eukprot:EJW04227.1 hypothetical protein EDEG_01484 [Edhazardia aedis USNM 41457]
MSKIFVLNMIQIMIGINSISMASTSRDQCEAQNKRSESEKESQCDDLSFLDSHIFLEFSKPNQLDTDSEFLKALHGDVFSEKNVINSFLVIPKRFLFDSTRSSRIHGDLMNDGIEIIFTPLNSDDQNDLKEVNGVVEALEVIFYSYLISKENSIESEEMSAQSKAEAIDLNEFMFHIQEDSFKSGVYNLHDKDTRTFFIPHDGAIKITFNSEKPEQEQEEKQAKKSKKSREKQEQAKKSKEVQAKKLEEVQAKN